MTRIGVLSDTHGKLPIEVLGQFAGVTRILHAGDVGDARILADLELLAPVHAVWGNTDGMALRARIPEIARLDVEGVRIVVLHGHQVGSPNPSSLADVEGDVIVFGHSHRPLVERVADRLYLNPGSAGAPRFGIGASIAELTLSAAGVEARLIPL